MAAKEEAEQKLKQLQMLEQNLQQILMQKQAFQGQLVEVDSALSEIDKANTTYKIIGNIMIESKKDDLKKDLQDRKESAELRITSLDKQEEKIREQAQKLQQEVLEKLKK
jgi:prefoldin beta subunit